jgi:voltage-gated potassium channel
MTTVTTIGYGDIASVTIVGRLIAMCIMIIGLGFVAVLTGAIAQHFISRQATETQIASTNDILAAVNEVKAEVHAVSDRLQQLETLLDRPAPTSVVPQQTTPLRRARPLNRGGRTR